jgi:hypothetical protein
MTPEEKQTLDSALKLIGSISPIGRTKLEAKLAQADENNKAQIAKWMREADSLAYFFQRGWKDTARAWILLKYLALFWAGPGQGAVPTENEHRDKLAELKRRSEPSLREEITDMVTGRGVLKIFGERQKSPSRIVWGTAFTDPAKHSPLSFCYLIHGMRPTTSIEVDEKNTPLRALYLKRTLAGNIGQIDTVGKKWQLLSARLFMTNPDNMKTEVLSCSIITNAHVKTYGNCSFGFVLSVPPMNVCAASSRDLAASGIQGQSRADKLEEETTVMGRMLQVDNFICGLVDAYYLPDIPSPMEVVGETPLESHNEVLVLGSVSGQVAKPTAIFVKVTNTRMMWQTFLDDDKQYALGALMMQCSRRRGIPIIEIPDNRGRASTMDFTTWKNVTSKLFS